MIGFDQGLRARSVSVSGVGNTAAILIVALRSMGDCVLSTATVALLRARYPDAAISVLTEHQYAWVFRHHPAVNEVLLAPELEDVDLFWQEQELVLSVIEGREFDRLVLLSDRLDNVPYFRAGSTFLEFYATQAGEPNAAEECYRLYLSPEDHDECGRLLAEGGIRGEYVVVHTRAGWPERTPPIGVFRDVCEYIIRKHDLPVVVVGGAGEFVAVDGVLNLAGRVAVETSAAIIANTRLFIGPDSGSMHVASAFDVPTLALYAGTSLRLVPPLSASAVAVQAVTSCPRPCGLSPCAQSECGAHGHDSTELLPHISSLLTGEVSVREWWGGRPARVIAGPEEPVIASQDALNCAVASPVGAVRRVPIRELQHLATESAVPWRRDPLQTAVQQRRLLALRTGMAARSQPIQVQWDTAVSHSLAIGCLQRGLLREAFVNLGAAIRELSRNDSCDPSADRRRERDRRLLQQTIACYSWPGDITRFFREQGLFAENGAGTTSAMAHQVRGDTRLHQGA